MFPRLPETRIFIWVEAPCTPHPQGSWPRRRPKTSGPAPSLVRSKLSSRAWPLTVWLGISCLTSLCVPPSPLCYT